MFPLISGHSPFPCTTAIVLNKILLEIRDFSNFLKSFNPMFTWLFQTRCLLERGMGRGRVTESTGPQYYFINSDLSTNCF